MLTSPEHAGGPPRQEALDLLKGKENPFESLVRPQKEDTRFRDLDVPGLLREPRQLLTQLIDSYRVHEYTGGADLRPTRVVIVRGDRGAGKTHLLRALQYRADGRSQILVRPSFYEVNLAFEEFLYHQLVGVLLGEDEVYSGRPFEDVARAVARRLLRQAVLGLGATDRLFACAPGRWRRLRLLWGGGERLAGRFDQLIERLDDPSAARDLPALVRGHGLAPDLCLRLVVGHLDRHERGRDPLVDIRRKLYTAMARLALLGDGEAMPRFLEGDYDQPGAGPNLRFTIVSGLLHVLTEACALERFPVVFAFDNLERLLSPQNRFDGELTRAFLNSLAQAVDNTRGLLLLLFAEHGLFDQQIVPYMDSFARDRLSQGVPLHGRGPVHLIDLKPPTAEEISLLVKSRIRDRLLPDLPAAERLPDAFPYSPGFLSDLAGAGTANLRAVMLRLRDEFARVVYRREPAAPEPTPTGKSWQSLLASLWADTLSTAGDRLKGPLVSHAPALHAGLGALLQQAKPLQLGGWILAEVQPAVSIGDNPNYGIVTLLDWRGAGGRPANGDGEARRIGIGFLLAGGPGMAPDLQAKFDLFRTRAHRADGLIIIWPRGKEADDPVDALPAKTREVWDQSRHRTRTELRRPAWDDVCALLAFPDWLARVAEASNGPAAPEAVREFLMGRCQSVFQLVQPAPAARTERTNADED